jgi:hypothetical protein
MKPRIINKRILLWIISYYICINHSHTFSHIRKFCAKYTKLINKFVKYLLNLKKRVAVNKTGHSSTLYMFCYCQNLEHVCYRNKRTAPLPDTFHFRNFLCDLGKFYCAIVTLHSPTPKFAFRRINVSNHVQQQPHGTVYTNISVYLLLDSNRLR